MKQQSHGRFLAHVRYPSGLQVGLEALFGRRPAAKILGPAIAVYCLWGDVRVSSPELGNVPLARGDTLCWPSGPLEIATGHGALALVVQGKPAAVQRLGALWDEPGWDGDSPVTDHLRMSRALMRALLAVIRSMRSSEGRLDPEAIPGLVDNLEGYRRDLSRRLAATPGRTLRNRQRGYERLVRVRLHVLSQPRRRWTLSDMAGYARFSMWHFQRAFVAVFDQTPHEFVQDVRWRLARRLLTQSHLSLSDIAASAGFDSPSNLSRLIKKRLGMTASRLRRGESEEHEGAVAAENAH